jgi:NAD(P)H-hydrate epimerase
MENAGAATAALARELLGGSVEGRKVVCLAGKGNNGGDGLVATRHLANWGADVSVVLGAGGDLGVTASRQLSSVKAMGVRIFESLPSLRGGDLLLDALLGYNSRGAPRSPLDEVIERSNASGVPILAVDVPSGLDPTSGSAHSPCIRAKATVSLGLPKTGFLEPGARAFVGDLYLADVSIPSGLYADLRQPLPLFGVGPLVKVS